MGVRMTMEQMGLEKDDTRRGLAALDRIEAMAVEGEPDEDGGELLAALAANRAAEGRTLRS